MCLWKKNWFIDCLWCVLVFFSTTVSVKKYQQFIRLARSRVTRSKSWSLHLNTFNPFLTKFKTRLYDSLTAIHQQFVICFCDVTIHINAVLRTLYFWNRMPLWFFTEIQKMFVLKAKQSLLTMQIVLLRRPCCTCTKLDTGLQTFWIVLTQRNAGCKTWNIPRKGNIDLG